jgi:hypothetical protein
MVTALMTAIPLAILYAARRLVDAAARLETIRTEPVPVREADGYDLGEETPC